MLAMIVTCGPVAFWGLPLVNVRRVLPSQAFRRTGESVLPSRPMTFSVLANSDSVTYNRLSETP